MDVGLHRPEKTTCCDCGKCQTLKSHRFKHCFIMSSSPNLNLSLTSESFEIPNQQKDGKFRSISFLGGRKYQNGNRVKQIYMKQLDDSSEQHDSVLETKTGRHGDRDRSSLFVDRNIIAERYAILGRLGRGGMGDVWRAFDLKLRVDVALKSLRSDRVQQNVESLRREVRTAREVISPNVCRIFDLVVIDNQELVSMEFIDGTTLAAHLQNKGPLELTEASNVAA